MPTVDEILQQQASGEIEQQKTTDRDRLGDFLAGLGGGIQGANAAQIVAQRQGARANEFAQNQRQKQQVLNRRLTAQEKIEGREQAKQLSDRASETSRKIQDQVIERAKQSKKLLQLEGLDDSTIENFVRSQSGDELGKMDTIQFLSKVRAEQLKRAAAKKKAQLDERRVKVAEGTLDLNRKKLNAEILKKAQPDKKAAAAAGEVTERFNNIKTSVKDLQKLIKDNGTFDLIGPQNAKLKQKIDTIAVDMAKMVDPDSVARKSEVDAFKELLFEPGLFTRNTTAKEIVSAFEDIVNKRLPEAFASRGLEMPEELLEATQTLAGTAKEPQPVGAIPTPADLEGMSNEELKRFIAQ